MRKIVRSIAVVALMLVVATGVAKEPKLSVTPNTEKSLSFEMAATAETTSLSIVDVDGNIIYTENVARVDIYSKKFNLDNLPTGSYFLKVEDTLKETIFSFAIVNNHIQLAERKEVAKPIFTAAEDRVMVSFLNLEKEEVKIKVLDSKNRVVFEEVITDEMMVEKVFNFEDALKDDYIVMVQNKKDSFFEEVTVK